MQDVAPYVLSPHQWDQGFSPARAASGQDTWQKALPAAAGSGSSGLSGLNSPNMCTEVFHFEAQEATTVQATQHAQRYLAGGSSMRGSGSIALPPVEGTQVGSLTSVTDNKFATAYLCKPSLPLYAIYLTIYWINLSHLPIFCHIFLSSHPSIHPC